MKASLDEYGDFIQDPLREDKLSINEEYREMDEKRKKYLRPVLNPEGKSAKTMDERLDDKVKLEIELMYMYVNYDIRLREIYSSIKIIGLMKSLIPEEKKFSILATESQQIDDDDFVDDI